VQDGAIGLAVEQAVPRRNIADSFVNLGRRNQNLLSRQLDFITALENKETEPGKLDGLFRLDHVAGREPPGDVVAQVTGRGDGEHVLLLLELLVARATAALAG
jgi:hypothetical protein